MNKFLASTIGFLNGLLAVIFIAGGAAAGSQMQEQGDLGTFLGLLAGLGLAVVICGFLALFIDMRNELIQIRKALNTD